MKKDVKNNNKINVLRWVLLVPSTIIAWYIVMFFVAPIPHLFYVWGWVKLLEYFEIPLAVLLGFLLPCVVVFFVSRWIAPKHKNIAGWSAVVFCVLWDLFLFFGMSHIAY